MVPGCVVLAIRSQFPDLSGQYIGFCESEKLNESDTGTFLLAGVILRLCHLSSKV